MSSLPIEPTRALSRALSEITAVEAGYQAALMAPTEIPAEQHFFYLQSLLQPLGVPAVLLSGGQRMAVREEILTAIQTGSAAVAVGTHALIETGVRFSRLGLGVVDEQHRFGVSQRTRLYEKAPAADILVMTATPIPRSLSLTLYGDLELMQAARAEAKRTLAGAG